MKTISVVLLINLVLFTGLVSAFTWFMVQHDVQSAHIVKPLVAWTFLIFYGYSAFSCPGLKGLAWRLFSVFFIYGVGDIVMEWGTVYTPLGMVFFFIGHVIYLWSLARMNDYESEQDVTPVMQPKTRKILAFICGFLIFACTTIAVIVVVRTSHEYIFCGGAEVYAQLFTTAAFLALIKFRRAGSIFLTVIGAFIYAASDITIAIERYVYPVWWMPVLVMSTYWGAVLCYAAAFFPVFFHGIEKKKAQ